MAKWFEESNDLPLNPLDNQDSPVTVGNPYLEAYQRGLSGLNPDGSPMITEAALSLLPSATLPSSAVSPSGFPSLPSIRKPNRPTEFTPEGLARVEEFRKGLQAVEPPKSDETPWIFGTDTLSAAKDYIANVPTFAKGAFYRLKESDVRPDLFSPEARAAFAEEKAAQDQIEAERLRREQAGESTKLGSAIREAIQSSGFSVGSMGAALPGAVLGAKGGALLGTPMGPAAATAGGVIGGIAGGMAASGAAAYRMQYSMFMEDAFNQAEAKSIKDNKRPLSEEEKQQLHTALEPLARDSALWETGPEAVGNAATLLGGGIALKLLGKGALSRIAGGAFKKAAIRTGAAAAGVGTELATETATQLGQAVAEAKRDALLEGRPMEEAVSRYDQPGGVGQAFQDILAPTIGTLVMFGLAGGAVKGGSKAYERIVTNPQDAETIIKLANDPNVLSAMPEASLQNLSRMSEWLGKQWFQSGERQQALKDAMGNLNAEISSRSAEPEAVKNERQRQLRDVWEKMQPVQQAGILRFLQNEPVPMTGWLDEEGKALLDKQGRALGEINVGGLRKLAETLGIKGKEFDVWRKGWQERLTGKWYGEQTPPTTPAPDIIYDDMGNPWRRNPKTNQLERVPTTGATTPTPPPAPGAPTPPTPAPTPLPTPPTPAPTPAPTPTAPALDADAIRKLDPIVFSNHFGRLTQAEFDAQPDDIKDAIAERVRTLPDSLRNLGALLNNQNVINYNKPTPPPVPVQRIGNQEATPVTPGTVDTLGKLAGLAGLQSTDITTTTIGTDTASLPGQPPFVPPAQPTPTQQPQPESTNAQEVQAETEVTPPVVPTPTPSVAPVATEQPVPVPVQGEPNAKGVPVDEEAVPEGGTVGEEGGQQIGGNLRQPGREPEGAQPASQGAQEGIAPAAQSYEYGLRARPYGPGTNIPTDFTALDNEFKDAGQRIRYGKVTYNRPLTDEEIAAAELVPMTPTELPAEPGGAAGGKKKEKEPAETPAQPEIAVPKPLSRDELISALKNSPIKNTEEYAKSVIVDYKYLVVGDIGLNETITSGKLADKIAISYDLKNPKNYIAYSALKQHPNLIVSNPLLENPEQRKPKLKQKSSPVQDELAVIPPGYIPIPDNAKKNPEGYMVKRTSKDWETRFELKPINGKLYAVPKEQVAAKPEAPVVKEPVAPTPTKKPEAKKQEEESPAVTKKVVAAKKSPKKALPALSEEDISASHKEAITILATKFRADPWAMAGPGNKDARKLVHEKLLAGTGKKATSQNSGVNAIKDRLIELSGIETKGKTVAKLDDELSDWIMETAGISKKPEPTIVQSEHIAESGEVEPATTAVIETAIKETLPEKMTAKERQRLIADSMGNVIKKLDDAIAGAPETDKGTAPVVIEIPSDGVFRIPDTKKALRAFKDKLLKTDILSQAFTEKGLRKGPVSETAPATRSTRVPKPDFSESALGAFEDTDSIENLANVWELVKSSETPYVLAYDEKNPSQPILMTHAETIPQRPAFVSARVFGSDVDSRWRAVDTKSGEIALRGTSRKDITERIGKDTITISKGWEPSKLTDEDVNAAIEKAIDRVAGLLGVDATGEAIQAELTRRMDVLADEAANREAKPLPPPIENIEPVATRFYLKPATIGYKGSWKGEPRDNYNVSVDWNSETQKWDISIVEMTPVSYYGKAAEIRLRINESAITEQLSEKLAEVYDRAKLPYKALETEEKAEAEPKAKKPKAKKTAPKPVEPEVSQQEEKAVEPPAGPAAQGEPEVTPLAEPALSSKAAIQSASAALDAIESVNVSESALSKPEAKPLTDYAQQVRQVAASQADFVKQLVSDLGEKVRRWAKALWKFTGKVIAILLASHIAINPNFNIQERAEAGLIVEKEASELSAPQQGAIAVSLSPNKKSIPESLASVSSNTAWINPNPYDLEDTNKPEEDLDKFKADIFLQKSQGELVSALRKDTSQQWQFIANSAIDRANRGEALTPIEHAWTMYGQEEGDNASIQKILDHFGSKLNQDKYPWCAPFVAYTHARAGVKGANTQSARAFLNVGKKVELTEALPGDIVVMWNDNPLTGGRTGYGGHVGYLVKQEGDVLWILGGNQQDAVNVTMFHTDRVLGVRRIEAKQPTSQVRLAQQSRTTTTPAGITRQGFTAAIRKRFPHLSGALDKMLARGERGQTGGLVLIDSADSNTIARVFAEKTGRNRDAVVQELVGDGTVQGLFDPRTGMVFAVLPNLTATTAPGVFIHEGGVHANQRADIDAAMQVLVNGRANAKRPELRAFLDNVYDRLEASDALNDPKEYTAYVAEEAVVQGRKNGFSAADGRFLDWVDRTIGKPVGDLIRRLVNAARGWAIRHGYLLKASQFTVDDLVNWAMAGVERTARGEIATVARPAVPRSTSGQWDTFYSELLKAVQDLKQNKAAGPQWASMLENMAKKGQIKQEELDWTGVKEWLEQQKESVRKEDLLNAIKENQVSVSEIKMAGDKKPEIYNDIVNARRNLYRNLSPFRDDIRGILKETEEVNYGQFSGPYWFIGTEGSSILDDIDAFSRNSYHFGNAWNLEIQDYDYIQEMIDAEETAALLTIKSIRKLKNLDSEEVSLIEDYIRDYIRELTSIDTRKINDNTRNTEWTMPGGENQRELVMSVPSIKPYNTDETHYGDVAGGRAIAWVRFNDRTDKDGKKILFIEEIQSKRHQEGRKEGYGTEVPDAPFKQTISGSANTLSGWAGLAFKRMLRYAAENGYDRLAWTTGEQQAKRYNLSQVVSRLEYDTEGGRFNATDRQGNLVYSGDYMSQDDVEDYIGKELSDILFNAPIKDGVFTLNLPEDKVLGGEGMKGFYDRLLPKEINKYVKKWDARVGQTAINTGAAVEPVHSIDITPSMVVSVMRGQSLFSYLGEKAKTANLTLLQQAKTRVEAGEDAEMVRKETGWFKGNDNKWRFEVDDSETKLLYPTDESAPYWYKRYWQGKVVYDFIGSNGIPTKLEYVLDAPQLYSAYPELKSAIVNLRVDSNLTESRGETAIHPSMKEQPFITVNSPSYEKLHKTLIHEVQHVIQIIEGFAHGGSIEPFAGSKEELAEEINKYKQSSYYRQVENEAIAIEDSWKNIDFSSYEFPEFALGKAKREAQQQANDYRKRSVFHDRLRELEQQFNYAISEADRYVRLAGEIEARDTASRLGMTPEQRLATQPYRDTMFRDGIKDEDVIVRFDAGTMASATEPTATEAQRQYDAVVAQYTNPDGSKKAGWMKAPNGKPTNLNERQWVQTRTPAFKAWFGDFENDPANASKVKDENGEPMVVWHGTDADFAVFDRSKLGENTLDNASDEWFGETSRIGFWFNSQPMTGVKYSPYSFDMPVFLNIRGNPDVFESISDLASELEARQETGEDFKNRMEAEGYDGIIINDEEFGGQSFSAFDPTQIKSSISSTGSFSPANPDIRFSRAPRPSVTAELDSVYLDAVQSGDMETAQRMVDEAAKKAGFTVGPVYHGGPDSGFTEFKAGEFGFHFGDAAAAKMMGDARRFYLRIQNPLRSKDLGVWKPDALIQRLGAMGSDGGIPWSRAMELQRESYAIQKKLRKKIENEDNFVEARKAHYQASKPAHAALKESGYDGVIYRNEAEGFGESFIAIDPSQIKSADPVTYDDAGNVIPLSQRFNPEQNDIRFSRRAPQGTSTIPSRYTKDGVEYQSEVFSDTGAREEMYDSIIARLRDKQWWKNRPFRNKLADLRPAWLNLLSLSHWVEMARDLPGLGELAAQFDRLGAAIDADKIDLKQQAFKIADTMRQEMVKARDRGNLLGKILQLSTLRRVRPYLPPQRVDYATQEQWRQATEDYQKLMAMMTDLKAHHPKLAALYDEIMGWQDADGKWNDGIIERMDKTYRKALEQRLGRQSSVYLDGLLGDARKAGKPSLAGQLHNLAQADLAAYRALRAAYDAYIATPNPTAAQRQAWQAGLSPAAATLWSPLLVQSERNRDSKSRKMIDDMLKRSEGTGKVRKDSQTAALRALRLADGEAYQRLKTALQARLQHHEPTALDHQEVKNNLPPNARSLFDAVVGGVVQNVEKVTLKNMLGKLETQAPKVKEPTDTSPLSARLRRWATQNPTGLDRVEKAVRGRLDAGKLKPNEIDTWREGLVDSENKPLPELQALYDELIAYTDAKVQPSLEALKQTYEQYRKSGPYFPLDRFGPYQVYAEREGHGKDGIGLPTFMAFENQADQKRAVQKLQAEGGWTIHTGYEIKESLTSKAPPTAFIATMFKSLDETVMDPKEREMLKDDIYQLYLHSLPELSVSKHFIHRQGIPGFSADALRAYAQLMNQKANAIARLRYSDRLVDTLVQMKKAAYDIGQDPATLEEGNRARMLTKQFEESFEWMMNPSNANWANRFTSFGFFWYLTNISTALVNLTQVPIWTFPELGAKFGTVAAFRAVNRAIGQHAAWKFSFGQRRKDAEQRIRDDYDGDMGRGLDRAERDGKISRTQPVALAGMGEAAPEYQGIGPAARFTRAAFDWLSQPFHQAEVANREITFVAAYRLARESEAAQGLSPEEAHDRAYQMAINAIDRTQFNYANYNRAPFMRSNLARVLFLFKSYSHNATFRQLRDMYQSLRFKTVKAARLAEQEALTRGDTAAVKMARQTINDIQEARKRLGLFVASAGIWGGAMGLPIYATVVGLAGALFGGDPDDPWDPELDAIAHLRNWLGDTGARVVMGGVVGQLPRTLNLIPGIDGVTGFDLSPRVSIDVLRMWYRPMPADLEGKSALDWFLTQNMGPMYGLLSGAVQAYSQVNEAAYTGQGIARGLEGMTPAIVRNILKAVRYAEEGVTTRQGDLLVPEVTWAMIAQQGIGLTPDIIAEQYDINAAKYEFKTKIERQRRRLTDRYVLAVERNDNELLSETLDFIDRFNQLNPEFPITSNSLTDSYRKWHRARAEEISGMYTPSRGLRARIEREFAGVSGEEEDMGED